jgi:hypothetical protein
VSARRDGSSKRWEGFGTVERQSLNLPKGHQKGQELSKLCQKGNYLFADVIVTKKIGQKDIQK